jgi:O-antigen/teichoic acid export membrane protein
LVIQGISIALVFVGNLLVARWAGADAYGNYVHIFNWISILSIMALGGMGDVAIARIPKYLANDQPGRVYSFARKSNRFILLSSIGIAILFLLIIYLLPLKTLHENRTEFLLASAGIYGMTFLSLNQNILQSLNYISQSQWVEKWIKPGLLALFFIAARWWLYRSDSRILVIIAVLIMGICCLVVFQLLWQKIKIYRLDTRSYLEENLRRKMSYFFSIDVLNLLSTKITMLILPYFSLQREVGIFNVSYRIADLVIYPFFLMNTVMPQLFSKHFGSELSHKQFLYSEATKLMTLISIPILLINIAAGKFFLGWFGKDFVEGYMALVQLSVAQFLFSLFGPAHIILTMMNKEKYATLALLIYVIVLLAGNLILVPVFGINGGTMGVIIGSLTYNGVLAFMAYRSCGVGSPYLLFLRDSLRK